MKRKRTDSVSEENSRGTKLPKIPNTLLGLLERAAARWPDNGIRICQRVADDHGEFMSYHQLLAEAKVCSICNKAPVNMIADVVQGMCSNSALKKSGSPTRASSVVFRRQPSECCMVLGHCHCRCYTCPTPSHEG